MIRPVLLLFPVIALCFGACAKVGVLERPAPLFGANAKAQYQAQQRAAAAAAAKKRERGEAEALPPDEADPGSVPSTPRNRPIEGQHQSPFGAPPPGVLPDPFNNPQ
ncbi:MAG TPA: hypothetical protein VII63_08335 [Caulobacteraceae bacterium]